MVWANNRQMENMGFFPGPVARAGSGKKIPELEDSHLKQPIQERHEQMMQNLVKSLSKS